MSESQTNEIKIRSRSRKFIQIDHELFEAYAGKLTPSAFMVYCALKKFADYHTGECYPKLDTLCVLLGTGISTIQRGLKELCDCGLVEKKSGQMEGKPNEYLILEYPVGGCSSMTSRVVKNDQGGCSLVNSPNKEELEPLNENQLTLSSPSAPNGDRSKKKRKTDSDPRHFPFRQKLEKYWNYLNPDQGEYYWTAADAKHLKFFLEKWPSMDLDKFHDWLWNRSQSESIIRSQVPYQFLSSLNIYADGTLNKFGKPEEESRARF